MKNILSEIYCESVRSKLCIAWVSAVVGLQMQFLFEIVFLHLFQFLKFVCIDKF